MARKDKDSEHKQLLAFVEELKKDNKAEYDRMERGLKLYEGKLWNLTDNEFLLRDRPEGRSTAQFNTIFANIEQTAPLVTASRPITKVVPRFPFMEKLGVTLNHVIKYVWEAHEMQHLLYKAVKNQMIFGTAIFKVGYNDEAPFGDVEISLINPMKFAIAPGYETIWEAPFVVTWDKKPLSWVRRNFPGVKELEPDAGSEDTRAYKFGDISEAQAHAKFVTVYEVWTRDDEAYEEILEDNDDGSKTKKRKKKYPYGKTCWFTEKQMLGTEAAKHRHGLPPYVELHDYIRPHNFLGMSEIAQTEGLHKEINALLKYISEYVRKYHDPNFLVDISQLSDESYQAVLDKMSEGGQYIPWDSTGEKSPPIIQINEGELNDLIIPYLTFLMDISDTVWGMADVLRGQVGKKERQSASELAMLRESADARTQQRLRNLEWSLRRLFKMILLTAMQYYEEPRDLSYREGDNRRYFSYGNSYAQAKEQMQPQPLTPQAQVAQQNGPMTKQNAAEIQRFEQEQADYAQFLEFFSDDEGTPPKDYDPISFDFDIEIQSDSTLPTDKQSRANLFLRLRQLKAIDIKSLLEALQVPNSEEIAKRVTEESGGGAQAKIAQLMKQNPQALQQLMAQRGGGQ